jgi:hypothetical protein
LYRSDSSEEESDSSASSFQHDDEENLKKSNIGGSELQFDMDFVPASNQVSSGRTSSSVVNEEDLLLDNFYLKKQRIDNENRKPLPPRHYHMDFGGVIMPPEPATVPKQQKSDSYDQFIQ